MKIGGHLDRYITREWFKVFFVTALGFPLVAILFELTDSLADYLSQGIAPATVALSYVYALPEKIFLVLPAAVLFATVFTVGALARNSELIASHASGVSFYRTLVPTFFSAVVATGIGLGLGEVSPQTTRLQLELLGERERFSQTKRFNFVYRAEEGWVYVVRSLDLIENEMRDPQLEREGTGPDYPTMVVQAQRASFTDSLERWTLRNGRLRMLAESSPEIEMQFDSLRLRSFTERPEDLLAEAKKPQEMRYAELGRYIEALERSGGDGRKLRVERALKIAVPFTCIIIAMFGAPLANAGHRSGSAYGVAIALGTTVGFLILLQLSQAFGTGGLIPPTVAAWVPNVLFGLIGLLLLQRVKT